MSDLDGSVDTGRRPPPSDVVLAGAVAMAVVSTTLLAPIGRPGTLGYLIILVASAALVWRRVYPLSVLGSPSW